jgi:hypothetical protein
MLKSAALLLTISLAFCASGAQAATVYCTSAGVPAGCVVRPTAPVAKALYCTSPGLPVGCVARPAAAATTRAPGVPVGCAPHPNAAAAVATPGAVGGRPGVGAPEVGVNNVGTNGAGVANQNGGVNRAGRR